MQITIREDAPIAEQLRDAIIDAIATGNLPPGTRLGSVREVAADFGINPATVKRAYDMLQELGIVKTKGRQGTFVQPRPEGDLRDQLRRALSPLLAQGYSFAAIRSGVDALEVELVKEKAR